MQKKGGRAPLGAAASEPGQSPPRRSPRREGTGPDSTETGLRRGERTQGHPLACASHPSLSFPFSTTLGRYALSTDAGLASIIFVERLPDRGVGFGDREGRIWRNFPPTLKGNTFGMRSTQLRTSSQPASKGGGPLQTPLGRRSGQAVNGTAPLRLPPASLFTKRFPPLVHVGSCHGDRITRPRPGH